MASQRVQERFRGGRRRRWQEHHAPGRNHPSPERVPRRAAQPPRGSQEVRHAALLLRRRGDRWRRGERRDGRWQEAPRGPRRPEGAGDDPGVPEPRESAGAEEPVEALLRARRGAGPAVHRRRWRGRDLGWFSRGGVELCGGGFAGDE